MSSWVRFPLRWLIDRLFTLESSPQVGGRNEVKSTLKRIRSALAVVLLLVVAYVLLGSTTPETEVFYTIEIREDQDVISVRMTVTPDSILFMDLFFGYPRLGRDLRVLNFQATREGRPLANWRSFPGFSAFERVFLGWSRDPITVTYEVHPYVPRGDQGKALSYLTETYGYLRGMYFLYSPIGVREKIARLTSWNIGTGEPAMAQAEFSLPEGWQVNDPWVETGRAVDIPTLSNTYWAFGRDAYLQKTGALSIGIFEDMSDEEATRLVKLIGSIHEEFAAITRFVPEQKASYWAVNILPPRPIHGGAAGSYSVLTERSMTTVAHEMFHWWNGLTIDSADEANWLKEGFTTYYEGKVLRNIGYWTDAQFASHLRELERILWTENPSLTLNLTDISIRFTGGNREPGDYERVYYGGALLAYYLDMELSERGQSLDMIWLALYEREQCITVQDFLEVLKSISDEALVLQTEGVIRGEIPLVPFN